MCKKKVLAVLVNYGGEQVEYLKLVLKELKAFRKFDVYTIVHSNIFINDINIDEIKIIKLENFQLLPLTCRKTIWERRELFDFFYYGENDHLFTENHLDNHIRYTKILPSNKIPGLIQFEQKDNVKYFPALHANYSWRQKVWNYGNLKFGHFDNLHQASFLLDKNQLFKVSRKIDFLSLYYPKPNIIQKVLIKFKKKFGYDVNVKNKYSVKCKVNTDIYEHGGFLKLICISEFNNNLIHHLPNLYINGEKGRKKLRGESQLMYSQVQNLLN